jgi:hypothetical protein
MNINNKHIRNGKMYRVTAVQPRSMTLWAKDLKQALEFCKARAIKPRKVVEVKLVDRFPALHGQTD